MFAKFSQFPVGAIIIANSKQSVMVHHCIIKITQIPPKGQMPAYYYVGYNDQCDD